MLGASLKRALELAAYTVDWVQSGEDAAAATAAEDYALVMLDLSLPGQSGMSVLRQMRAARNLTPVIIVTANDRSDQKVGGLDAGADDYHGQALRPGRAAGADPRPDPPPRPARASDCARASAGLTGWT